MRVEHLSDVEVQSLLDNSFDGNRTEAQEHIEHCSDCAAMVLEYEAIWQELRIDNLPAVDKEFSNRVIQRLQPSLASEPKVPAILVAGLLLALVASSVATHIYVGWEWVSAIISSSTSILGFVGEGAVNALNWVMAHSKILGAIGTSVLIISFYGLLDGVLRRQRIHRLR